MQPASAAEPLGVRPRADGAGCCWMGAPPGSSQWDLALTFLRLPTVERMGDTTPLRRDALKQIKACKVLRNVLVKKLHIGKLEIVTTWRLFFNDAVLQPCASPGEKNELQTLGVLKGTFLLRLVCVSSRSSWKSRLGYYDAVRNNLWACTCVCKR